MFRPSASILTALLLAAGAGGIAHAESLSLRYGIAPGQSWSAVQTIVRETSLGGETRSDRGTARFSYRVAATQEPDRLLLDARMLSQSVGEEESPVDFASIAFHASTDRRGVMRGVRFELGVVDPPDLPGIEPDPVAFRQMLRRVAEAWIDSVYWLPELPERALAVGESFVIGARDDVGGTEPGVRMEMVSKTTYTLRELSEGVARFDVAIRSSVEASTAQSAVESRRIAEGEADFDLELGMWTRHQTRSEHHAVFSGDPTGQGSASARTTTTIEMTRQGD